MAAPHSYPAHVPDDQQNDDWLALTDAELLAQCRFDRFRVSGPGGQHRNRRDTAVRLVHTPTGIAGQASERRSQAQNRAAALQRLRRAIALEVRRPAPLDAYHPPPALQRILPGARDQIGPRHREFWTGAQHLLDIFDALDASLGDTAAAVGCSTNRLARLLAADPHLLRKANDLRRQRGFAPIRP